MNLSLSKRSVVASDATELLLRRHVKTVSDSMEDWLAEVCTMRGRVCYDRGHRPSFRQPDGSLFDGDALDLEAYHIIAQWPSRAVGCARIVPLREVKAGMISSTIGDQAFDGILRDFGTTRERTCEASRWVVVPEYRGGLGPWIVAATWAVARWLAADIAFVLAGTRQRQDLILSRMGARPVHGLPLVASKVFEDELRLLYFDVPHPSRSMLRKMDEAATSLNLASLATVR